MGTTDYIATWFYRESGEGTSFYPQAGRGDSPLLHSIYMQIQVTFLTTFRYYNPAAKLLFFTNLEETLLPPFLRATLKRTATETVTLPYLHRPPKDWYKAWANQFYLYDMLLYMERRMKRGDTVTVCDGDCLCRAPLDTLIASVRSQGSALYPLDYPRTKAVNGTTTEEMEQIYEGCYGEKKTLRYYGGEFISLRDDAVAAVNKEYPRLWKYNISQPSGAPRLNEEAHTFSLLAARAGIEHGTAGVYVKRLWTLPAYNNVTKGDERLAVWHLPCEKKTGLHRLCRLILSRGGMGDEKTFWKKAGRWCGVPRTGLCKRLADPCIRWQERIASALRCAAQ